MTAVTGAAYTGVINRSRRPGNCAMAIIAGVQAGNVSSCFTGGCCPIVAAVTGAG